MTNRPGLLMWLLLTASLCTHAAESTSDDVGSGPTAEREAAIADARTRLGAAAEDLARLHAEGGGNVRFMFHAADGNTEAHALNAVSVIRPMASDGAVLGIVPIPDPQGGVVVGHVIADSGAESAGVKEGDVLLAINDTELQGVEGLDRLLSVMRQVAPGDSVTLTRKTNGGGEEALSVVTTAAKAGAEWPAFAPAAADVEMFNLETGPAPVPGMFVARAAVAHLADMELVSLSARLGRYFGVDGGVLIVRAPAANSELEDGDVITHVAGAGVDSPADVVQALMRAPREGKVEVNVMRDRSALVVSLAPLSARAPVAGKREVRILRRGPAPGSASPEPAN